MGVIYLLCFDRSYRHARHYLGFTESLDRRLAEHRAGRGSPLVAAAIADGIDFRLARTWPGDRGMERRLHRQKNSRARLCPLCRGEQPPGATDGPRVGVEVVVDAGDELVVATLAALAEPVTLIALHSHLRRRGERVGSLHGRLELLALKGRVRKSWVLGEIAWGTVS